MKFASILASGLVALAAVAIGSQASAKAGGGSGTAIGPAGCGLGHLVLGGRDMQIFAATLNATGVQTFGITTGTSDCEQGGKGLVMLDYIQKNKQALENDIARGQGESIVALAQITGCTDSTSLNTELKGHYSEIFPQAEPSTAHISNEIKRVINESPALKTSCTPLT